MDVAWQFAVVPSNELGMYAAGHSYLLSFFVLFHHICSGIDVPRDWLLLYCSNGESVGRPQQLSSGLGYWPGPQLVRDTAPSNMCISRAQLDKHVLFFATAHSHQRDRQPLRLMFLRFEEVGPLVYPDAPSVWSAGPRLLRW